MSRELTERLFAEAERRGVTPSEVIRDLVEAGLSTGDQSATVRLADVHRVIDAPAQRGLGSLVEVLPRSAARLGTSWTDVHVSCAGLPASAMVESGSVRGAQLGSRRFICHLDRVRRRFLGGPPHVTPALLTHLTTVDYVRRFALVAADAATGRGIAVARKIPKG